MQKDGPGPKLSHGMPLMHHALNWEWSVLNLSWEMLAKLMAIRTGHLNAQGGNMTRGTADLDG